MTTPEYLKIMAKTKRGKRMRASSAENSPQATSEGPSVVAEVFERTEEPDRQRVRRGPIEVSSSPTPSPPHRSSERPLVISTGAGIDELWGKGLTPSYRDASRPPPVFTSASPLTPETLSLLNRVEEDSHKAASLVGSFRDLHAHYVEMHSKYTASALKCDELMTEKAKVSVDLEETKKRLLEAETLNLDLEKDKTDLTTELVELRSSSELSKSKLGSVETDLKNTQAELDQAREAVAGAAIQAFDNALAQVRALHPDLSLDEVGVTNIVQDGKIVPAFVDEEGSEEENQ